MTRGWVLSTLAFLLSPKSAYVSGQVVRIGTTPGHTGGGKVTDWLRPLEGKVAWSPARAGASASRSPACSTATAPPSSASTCLRPPTRW